MAKTRETVAAIQADGAETRPLNADKMPAAPVDVNRQMKRPRTDPAVNNVLGKLEKLLDFLETEENGAKVELIDALRMLAIVCGRISAQPPAASAGPAPARSRARTATGDAGDPTPCEVGDIVLFRLREGPGAGEWRPAIVVRVHDDDVYRNYQSLDDRTTIPTISLHVYVDEDIEALVTRWEPVVLRGMGLGEYQRT